MAYKISEETIKEWCDKLNYQYIERYFDNEIKRTYVKIICKNHSYKGEQILDLSVLKYRAKMGKCMCDRTSRDTEDLKRDKNLNPNVEILGEYVKSQIKIKCRCKKCGYEWDATPNKLQQGKGCPKCKWKTISEKNKISQEEYEQKLKEKQPTLEIIGEYTGMNNLIKYRCTVCGYIGMHKAVNLLSLDASCRHCKSTTGERKICDWLLLNNITFEQEYSFSDCRDINPLRFDFYLPDYNICIEYQGEQHYKPVKFRKDKYQDIDEDFKKQIKRDNIKREFCNDNNIKLIEVPYWEINNIKEYLNTRIKI